MICIKVNIPQELCEIDDELKAIYHSKDTICFFIQIPVYAGKNAGKYLC